MARKRPVWSKAMRTRAAEHGRQGSRAEKQLGALEWWHTRSPEEQAARLARLHTRRGRQGNRSAKARAAQAARAKARWARRPALSATQAEWMADAGMLKRAPMPAPAPALPEGYPIQGAHEDDRAYRCRVQDWHRARYEEGRVAE